MNKFILIGVTTAALASARAQGAASTQAASPDLENLRQQVQALTETVEALQQQVKDQQAVLEKANLTGESGLPQNPEPSPISALTPQWVESPFLVASIFEHAPPAHS